MAADPVYGVGTKAYLDSTQGLIPCIVKKLERDKNFGTIRITVHFPEDEEPLHWSGMTKNVWKGKTATFSSTQIVPRSAVKGDTIRGIYTWKVGDEAG